LSSLQQAYPGRSLDQLLAEPPGDWMATLRDAGFVLSQRQLTELAEFRRRALDLEAISRAVLEPELRGAVAREIGVDPSNLAFDVVVAHVIDEQRAGWLSDT